MKKHDTICQLSHDRQHRYWFPLEMVYPWKQQLEIIKKLPQQISVIRFLVCLYSHCLAGEVIHCLPVVLAYYFVDILTSSSVRYITCRSTIPKSNTQTWDPRSLCMPEKQKQWMCQIGECTVIHQMWLMFHAYSDQYKNPLQNLNCHIWQAWLKNKKQQNQWLSLESNCLALIPYLSENWSCRSEALS